GAVIKFIICRMPAIAASGTTGGASPRRSDSGAPSISDHTTASCEHNAGIFVSGGHARSGCVSRISRSNVDPDRPMHNTNTGSATRPPPRLPFKPPGTGTSSRPTATPPANHSLHPQPQNDEQVPDPVKTG